MSMMPFAAVSLHGLTKEGRGAFEQMEKSSSFVHSLQLVHNPLAMDDFNLSDVETVLSEYAYACDEDKLNRSFSESIVITQIDSMFDSTTDPSLDDSFISRSLLWFTELFIYLPVT